ncbi:PAS domain-containing hybrid sensor histidine kinase/response regulator [Sunxiuqinia indica]|uniref:PAS domain-containing hybrid sensor histidine kinase/response regulator n=1 Tax=Sunxiuqinia indica TaxID=2692584 RepID=UPI00135762FB|nr:PAS domain-containing hybrid sensor histidine kinase/response regulator [Sunxiuqinia indica]
MKNKQLRKEAEKLASDKYADIANLSTHDIQKIVYELEVHRIELEMQNDELRSSQKELEDERANFADLYNHAPVGYISIDKNQLVLQANETIASMLQCSREAVENQKFTNFIHWDDKDRFYLFIRNIQTKGEPRSCQLRLNTEKNHWVYANLEANSKKDNYVRIAITDITNLVEAQQKAEESEEKYRALYENAPLPYQSLNDNGRFIDVNPAWLSTLGYKREKVIGKFYKDFLHPDWQGHFEKNFPAFKKRGYVKDVQFKIRHKKGHFLDISFDGCIGYLPDGSFRQTYCVFQDITKEKQIENALIEAKEKAEESEKFLNLAGEISKVGGWRLDLKSNQIIWSRTTGRIHELPDDFIPSLDEAISYYHKEDQTLVRKSVEKAIKEGVAYEFEARLITAKGNLVWVNAIGKPEMRDGKCIGISGSFQDITERKKAQEALLRSEKEFRLLAESMPQIVWITLPDGMNIYFNKQWVDYTGLSLEESYGDGWNIPFHPDDQKRAWDAWQAAVKNNDNYSIECRLRRKDGEYFWWLVRGVPIFDEKGDIAKWFGTCTDIQSIKDSEKELLQAKEKAEESTRLKSAFLANMSHEIRTPMNGIIGFTSLLKNPKLTGKQQKKFINIIEKSGERMLNTIKDIMDISKIESGQVDVKFSDVDLNNQLDELFAFFQPETTKKNIKLSITNRLPDQQATVYSDKEKLNSILVNFIKNAIKYTRGGSIEFGYSINKKANDKELEFYVKDTGIGIPTERQEAVFNRFVQADIDDKQVYEGSGLGLAISKAYVEMLGGEIWVESEEGVGSQFYFTIPYKTNTKEIHEKNTEDLNQPQSIEKELKILIAEDDETTITYLNIILNEYARELLIAKTGTEAVEMCRNNPELDIILMDIRMPELDGYEATKRIREFNKEVFIMAQTAYAQSEDREKAIEAGCDEYISKPINQTKLVEIISNRF